MVTKECNSRIETADFNSRFHNSESHSYFCNINCLKGGLKT